MDHFSHGEKRSWSAVGEDQVGRDLFQQAQTDPAKRPCLPFETNLLTCETSSPWDVQDCEVGNAVCERAVTVNLPQITSPGGPGQNLGNQDTDNTVFPSIDNWFTPSTGSSNSSPVSNEPLTDLQDTGNSEDIQEHLSACSINLNSSKHDVDTCLGMINDPNIRLSALGNEDATRIDVTLDIDGLIAIVRHHSSAQYGGLLDRHVADALIKLSKDFNVTFVAFLLLKRTAKKKPTQCKLCIVLQGLREDADGIGEILSNSDIYLQPPQGFTSSLPYFNPQYLYLPGSEETTVQSQDSFGNSTGSSVFMTENDPLKRQVLQVFDSARGPASYSGVSASPRLRTPLKDHQAKALSMMIEKESGKVEGNEFGSLWALYVLPNGEKRYKNVITGLISPDPPVCLGGLLADEMGLGKTLSMLSLVTKYLDIVDEAVAAPNGTSMRTTLIVTPMSLLQTWEEQINRHIHPHRISYYIYHGTARRKAFLEQRPEDYDIVLTTYDTVALEESRDISGASSTATKLKDFTWCRIVLDEAHMIRNASSKRCRALMTLKTQHRWCLTGSPMFNRVEDFGSLLSFLRAAPFHEPSVFKSYVSNLLENYPERALKNLRQLVQSVSLRRTKASVFGQLQLPTRQIRVQEVLLDDEERHLYDVLKKSYARVFATAVFSEKDSKFTHCIFQTISRLRQYCDHGRDLLPRSAQAVFDDFVDGDLVTNELMRASQTCGGCLTTMNSREDDRAEDSFLECGHSLCTSCQRRREDSMIMDSGSCKCCSESRTPVRSPGAISPVPQQVDPRGILVPYRPSSKVKVLIRNLQVELAESTKPLVKSVIFSCWTKMLDQVEKALKMNGLQFERVDGSKSDSQRRNAIERFRTQDNCRILLASIGSAGVGLDLTVASRVHLIEPQWSPMAEEQALDRVHRMGQTREVVATKYVVKDSIEEYVISVQEMKSRVIKQSLERSESIDTLSARERFMKYLEES